MNGTAHLDQTIERVTTPLDDIVLAAQAGRGPALYLCAGRTSRLRDRLLARGAILGPLRENRSQRGRQHSYKSAVP